MNIIKESDNYTIVDTESVLLFELNSDLKLRISASTGFSFILMLKFESDNSGKQKLEKIVPDDNTIIFKCTNFDNRLGIGTKTPVPVATVAGKEWFLHFWVYCMGDKGDLVRKVEYTLFEKKDEVQ